MIERIYLVGFMGSGKSYGGQQLAQKLAWNFLDLDQKIEAKENRSISAIFAESGEGYFREIERSALLDTSKLRRTVIATGGGTPCFFENINWINQAGHSFFLNPAIETLVQRLKNETEKRPLLSQQSNLTQYIQEKLTARLPQYQQAKHEVNSWQEAYQIIQKLKQHE